MIQKLKDLEVDERAFDLAIPVFELTGPFPKEEVYSLEIIGKIDHKPA
jgi:hypothetical protein